MSKNIDNQIKEVLRIAGVKSLFLLEGINEVKPHFPLIDDNTFTKLIKLDPTYDGSDRLGKYGKWILSLYNNFLKDQVAYQKWEEQKKLGKVYPQPEKKSIDKIEDFEKLPDLLKQFNVINKKSKVRMETIKSVSSLATIISNEKSKGISSNEKVNHGIDLFKKSVSKGGKVVFKDNQWIVLVPETFESSKVFGEDTHWCTTSSDRYYDRYLNIHGGKYFINLDLSTGDLYQYHFESKQFMDSNDSPIFIFDIVKSDSQLKDFYANYIQHNNMKNKSIFLLALSGKITEDYVLEQLFYDSTLIQYISNPSENLQLKVVHRNGQSIQYIKNPSEKVQLEAVNRDIWAIHYIENPTEKVQLNVVQRNGKFLGDIAHPTAKVELEAIKNNYKAIEYINNPTEKVQLYVITQDPFAIEYINNPTEKVQLIAVKNNYKAIQYIENPSEKVQLKAVKHNGLVIYYIENPSEKVQLEAVKQNGYAIQYINNPSEKVQLLAIKNDSYAIEFIENPTPKVKALYQRLYGNK